MEDGVSTKEAIDVKKGRKKKESFFSAFTRLRRQILLFRDNFYCLYTVSSLFITVAVLFIY